jgi:hypothetical protein
MDGIWYNSVSLCTSSSPLLMTKAFITVCSGCTQVTYRSTVERSSLFRSELCVNTELDLTFLLAFREEGWDQGLITEHLYKMYKAVQALYNAVLILVRAQLSALGWDSTF